MNCRTKQHCLALIFVDYFVITLSMILLAIIIILHAIAVSDDPSDVTIKCEVLDGTFFPEMYSCNGEPANIVSSKVKKLAEEPECSIHPAIRAHPPILHVYTDRGWA